MSGQYSQQYCTMDLIGIAFSRDSGNRTVVTLTLVDLHISTLHVRAIAVSIFLFLFFLFIFFFISLCFYFCSLIPFRFSPCHFDVSHCGNSNARDLQECLLFSTVPRVRFLIAYSRLNHCLFVKYYRKDISDIII